MPRVPRPQPSKQSADSIGLRVVWGDDEPGGEPPGVQLPLALKWCGIADVTTAPDARPTPSATIADIDGRLYRIEFWATPPDHRQDLQQAHVGPGYFSLRPL